MSGELKSCPFCGNAEPLAHGAEVECLGCGAFGPEYGGVDWNRRVASPGCAQHSPNLAQAATLLKDCRRLLPGSTLGDRLRSRIGALLREWGEEACNS